MTKKKTGRPDIYTKELASKVCAEIVQGRSLRTIGSMEGMPSVSCIFTWFDKYPEFKEQYARAKEEQADAFAEEILDISDDGTNDWMENFDKEGNAIGWKVNGESIQRSKLRVDSRKWLMSKFKVKKYGDSQTINSQELDKDGNKTDTVDQLLKLINESKDNG